MATKLYIGTDGDLAANANWSPANTPINGDDVVFENGTDDLDTNLDQSAVTLDSLTIKQSWVGQFGTATAYVQWGATEVFIGEKLGKASPNGSPRIKLDMGAVAGTVTIYNTASTSTDPELLPVLLKMTEATIDVYVRSGDVGIAWGSALETSTLRAIHVLGSQARVSIGNGVTLTELDLAAGRTDLLCAATTVTVKAGNLVTEQGGAITTMTVTGGNVVSNSIGTIGTLNAKGGVVDFLQSSEPRIVTTTDIWRGADLRLDLSYLTLTNDPEPQEPMTLTAA